MSLHEQMAIDQDTVFFNTDDFATRADINGVTLTVLLHDLLLKGEETDIMVERKRLMVRPADISWQPVQGREVEVNGDIFIIEHVGGGLHTDDDGAWPWDMRLVRYLT